MILELKHEISDDMVKDVLTTAIEGGIGYWACLHNDHQDWVENRRAWKEEHDGKTPCYCDTAFRVLSTGKSIHFSDAEADDEADDEEIWELDMTKLAHGIELWEQRKKMTLNKAFDDSSFDAIDADMIIQFALFDEIIYG